MHKQKGPHLLPKKPGIGSIPLCLPLVDFFVQRLCLAIFAAQHASAIFEKGIVDLLYSHAAFTSDV
jgi:hypothetical protein